MSLGQWTRTTQGQAGCPSCRQTMGWTAARRLPRWELFWRLVWLQLRQPRWTPTSPPCTSPPPLSQPLALATLQAAQGWKGFSLFLSCLSEVNSHSAICIEAPTPPSTDARNNIWQRRLHCGQDVWTKGRIRQKGAIQKNLLFFLIPIQIL